MSDFQFGTDDYRLNYYPHEAYDGMGGVDWGKVESVEIEFDTYVKERTCRDLGGCDTAGMQVFNCSECGCVLSLFDVSGLNTLCTNHIYDYPRYCPNCGAKVVDE